MSFKLEQHKIELKELHTISSTLLYIGSGESF